VLYSINYLQRVGQVTINVYTLLLNLTVHAAETLSLEKWFPINK